MIDFVNFYPVSLVNNVLDRQTEIALIHHVLHHESGIYYIYDRSLSILPESFESKKASQYLAAIELLARYRCAKEPLRFVTDWLKEQQKANGQWDMGPKANDKTYFPLSDDWRRKETREADCTERIPPCCKHCMKQKIPSGNTDCPTGFFGYSPKAFSHHGTSMYSPSI